MNRLKDCVCFLLAHSEKPSSIHDRANTRYSTGCLLRKTDVAVSEPFWISDSIYQGRVVCSIYLFATLLKGLESMDQSLARPRVLGERGRERGILRT